MQIKKLLQPQLYVSLSPWKDIIPPDFVHCVTLKSLLLNPGTYRTPGRYMLYTFLVLISTTLMETVPMVVAWMMLPLATSTAALVDLWSLTKSSTKGVMCVEQPESINHCDTKMFVPFCCDGLLGRHIVVVEL